MMSMNRGEFKESDLEKVDTSRMVVLNSGSPLMEVETVDGENALCSWWEDGKRGMVVLPTACLSRLVRVTAEELKSFAKG